MSKIKYKGRAGEIQDEIAALVRQVEKKEQQLQEHLARCPHTNWEPIQYVPYDIGGYSYEGDPPGTMGVDRRPGGYVPRETKKRWTRTCPDCGYVQETERTHQVKRSFSGGVEGFVDEPLFGTPR